MNVSAPTIFEAFNARNLTPEEVAKTFIPPSHFANLCLSSHTLVVGPRGSGKTTLLKMLQLPALRAWKHLNASEYRRNVSFIGVFVPADISWRKQHDALETKKVPIELANRLGLAAFTTHVLISLVEAMRGVNVAPLSQDSSLSHLNFIFDKSVEEEMVRLIEMNWRVRPPIRSLFGLQLGLRERLSWIGQIASKRLESSYKEDALSKEIESQDGLHIQFIDAVSFALDVFNNLVQAPSLKWALLFDELEIAPAPLRKSLLESLRSTDQRLLFKLSLSPFSQEFTVLRDPQAPMPAHDFMTIPLWYSHKEEGYEFAETLLAAMLNAYHCENISSEGVFGTAQFESERSSETGLESYVPGSMQYQKFRLLSERDSGFREYLRRNKINIQKMHLMHDTERASQVRKVTSLITVRNAFRAEEGDPNDDSKKRVVIRSRKNPAIYTGASSLFAITEGNPRWFIGMIGPMVRQFAESHKTIPGHIQAKAIAIASNRFRALLSTIAVPGDGRERHRGVLDVLDQIGRYIFDRVVLDDFSPEPPTTFIVDSATPISIQKALGLAMNAGAIVHIPEKPGELMIGEVQGKRFRLSYMLAPYYKLPITIGKARILSSILSSQKSANIQLPGLA